MTKKQNDKRLQELKELTLMLNDDQIRQLTFEYELDISLMLGVYNAPPPKPLTEDDLIRAYYRIL